MSAADVMAGVVLRDIKMAIHNARKAKRDLTPMERGGMLQRAERWGVEQQAAELLEGR